MGLFRNSCLEYSWVKAYLLIRDISLEIGKTNTHVALQPSGSGAKCWQRWETLRQLMVSYLEYRKTIFMYFQFYYINLNLLSHRDLNYFEELYFVNIFLLLLYCLTSSETLFWFPSLYIIQMSHLRNTSFSLDRKR